jgi:pyridoxine kinase
MASIPILYREGMQVAVLPSAVLSTNTDYQGYQMQDLCAQLERSVEHWAGLGVSFDAVYSGFLAGEDQVRLVIRAIEQFKANRGLVLIDPVLGDNGVLYSCYKPAMVKAMRNCCLWLISSLPISARLACFWGVIMIPTSGIRKRWIIAGSCKTWGQRR